MYSIIQAFFVRAWWWVWMWYERWKKVSVFLRKHGDTSCCLTQIPKCGFFCGNRHRNWRITRHWMSIVLDYSVFSQWLRALRMLKQYTLQQPIPPPTVSVEGVLARVVNVLILTRKHGGMEDRRKETLESAMVGIIPGYYTHNPLTQSCTMHVHWVCCCWHWRVVLTQHTCIVHDCVSGLWV